ncbi:TIGR04282 family arsenosugar biosynthesis glycosyltransferase [Leptospira sp. GIMC2001]|uniref:TIGR04282 family arsenosugar biosynthesis glycosyltransferase n=1 Tax=Leptospira sp. GIMC2001 TaxID=1513297 RepID=UPI002349A440|nr:TIGR04282 family arsenosugar biosynthesis glycosyltransferase [Leptospira sp. GIMC2001]WCL50290.1 TIGR04282 family arsenosugar biosynthesis glycosyltransferase [Leptospira sp. GIMC2001]
MNNLNLIVFAKHPQLGKVKTRLAVDLGEDQALSIYLQLLQYTKDLAKSNYWNTYWFWDEKIDNNYSLPNNFQVRFQSKGNLGARMSSAFEEIFNLETRIISSHSKICIIGSDCPDLSPKIVLSAFEFLDKSDFVIGPSRDGGYYLLGMREFSETIFQSIDWSTDKVLDQTIERIASMGKTYKLLEMLIDIDTAKDWQEFSKLTKTQTNP